VHVFFSGGRLSIREPELIRDEEKAALRSLVCGGVRLIFGPMASRSAGDRSHAEWAQWHSGVEFLTPVWERDCLLLASRGWTCRALAEVARIDEYEVQAALGRQARTLATYERNASRWASRYVAREPQASATDGASERDQRRERTNRRGRV
jgi:hypothetical protein